MNTWIVKRKTVKEITAKTLLILTKKELQLSDLILNLTSDLTGLKKSIAVKGSISPS